MHAVQAQTRSLPMDFVDKTDRRENMKTARELTKRTTTPSIKNHNMQTKFQTTDSQNRQQTERAAAAAAPT